MHWALYHEQRALLLVGRKGPRAVSDTVKRDNNLFPLGEWNPD
jgi:hypothetical protein